MQLIVNLGATVVAQLDGHSASNGANIPANSTITLTSNDMTVATVPDTVPVPSDTQSIPNIPVTILAVGATDISFHLVTPDNTPYDGVANLVVNPAPAPGLVSVSITLLDVTPKV